MGRTLPQCTLPIFLLQTVFFQMVLERKSQCSPPCPVHYPYCFVSYVRIFKPLHTCSPQGVFPTLPHISDLLLGAQRSLYSQIRTRETRNVNTLGCFLKRGRICLVDIIKDLVAFCYLYRQTPKSPRTFIPDHPP